jgi:predicted transcriptional regulator YdeE
MTLITLQHDLVIIGLPLRTSPENAGRDIGAHWQRFMSSRKEAATDLYAVYCDYESDWRGAYTMVLGSAAKPDEAVPSGERRVRIPRGDYASFRASGAPAEAVWKTWMHINTEWPDRSRRRYIADFERYAPDAFAGGKVEADISVGL